MVKKVILFTSPLLLLIEIIIFNLIVGLLSKPSDMAVFMGVICICISFVGNFFLFKFIIEQVKK